MNKILLLVVLVGLASASYYRRHCDDPAKSNSDYYAPLPPMPSPRSISKNFLLSFQYACS